VVLTQLHVMHSSDHKHLCLSPLRASQVVLTPATYGTPHFVRVNYGLQEVRKGTLTLALAHPPVLMALCAL
jgi:hypothetical protein